MNAVDEWTQSHTGGQTAAILSKVCGGDTEKLDALLRDELRVELKEVLKKLFGKFGRRIPEGLLANVCDADRSFRLEQPSFIDLEKYGERLQRLHDSLEIDTGVSDEVFCREINRLMGIILENSQIANITKGVYLPIVLPQLTTDDLGATLEQYFEAASKSYAKTFNGREFFNHHKGALAGEVNIVNGSRHDQLIVKMKQGPVIGIHFPNPLQGYSFNASREQMATLPEGFILSGLDTVIAMAMYPDVLARDDKTPGLDLAALSWRSAACSLFFPTGGRLYFNDTFNLAGIYVHFSGGLLFVG